MDTPEGTQYVLNVNLAIEQVEPGGYRRGQGLEVREAIILPAMSFLELAAILGQFHELAQTIKRERSAT